MSKQQTMEFHAKSIPEVLESLQTSVEGLSGAEAKKRLATYGRNVLPTTGGVASRLKVFFGQWKNPLIIILVVAGVVSGFLGETADMAIIFITAGINTIVGFIQEDKANQSLKKLQSIVKYQAVVLRDGRKTVIPSEDVVPGDILFLSAGDKVQADGRVMQAVELRVNEAPLTGESLPVKKSADEIPEDRIVAERMNMVYRGTAITDGECVAVVTSQGKETEIGRIATLVQRTVEEQTPLQIQLARIARQIGWVVISIAAFIFIIGEVFARTRYAPLELFKTSVAVAVAAIPEGLVISLTVVLAVGMQQILKRQALVRRMLAAETLGSVSVICTDKTGTLTLGDMRVTKIVTARDAMDGRDLTALNGPAAAEHADIALALRMAVLASNATVQNPDDSEKEWKFVGDTTEAALVRAGILKHDLDAAMPRMHEIAFTSERKFMATMHGAGRGATLAAKGAPEKIIARATMMEDRGAVAPLTPAKRKFFIETAEALARDGFRLLAIGYRRYEALPQSLAEADVSQLTLVGIIALADPIRSDVKETIQLVHRAGIRVVMVTGDHKVTARYIAEAVGMSVSEDAVLEGLELDAMSDTELAEAVSRVVVFARVDPSHKLRIVRAFQANGEVVAVTGDGVNDAPALKAADIGVAVGSGTDVAKETADLVLLNDSFSTIVASIQEGRRLYQNIKKVVLYLLSGSFAEVVLVTGSILAGLPLAVIPAQILWVNIIEDSFPNIALAFDSGEKEAMKEPPRKKGASIFDLEMKVLIAIISIVSNLVLFGLFLYFLHGDMELAHVRTLMFVGLGIDSLLYIYSVRSMRRHFWQMPMFDNRYLTGATILGLLLLVGAVYAPPLQILLRTVALTPAEWGFMALFGVLNVALIEFVKHFFLNGQKKYAA